MECATLPFQIPVDEDAPTVVNDRVSLLDFEGIGLVMVDGHLWHRYALDDRSAVSFIVGTLAFSGLAGPVDLGRAFEIDRKTVYRFRKRIEDEGARGALPKKRGPKGPHKVDPALRKKILSLKEQKLSNVAIGRRLGISEGTVRRILREEGFAPPPPPSLPGLVEEPATPEAAGAAGAPEVWGPEEHAGAIELEEDHGGEEEEPLHKGRRPVAEAVEPRSVERALARFGAILEAAPDLQPGENLRHAGVLLALPAISDLGVLEVTKAVYGSLKAGFYGLRSVVLTFLFMALLRIRRPEGLKGLPPEVMGRHLGLDRSPEVKTIRRKLTEIAARGKSHELVTEIARRLAREHDEVLGFLYVDGHVRAYHGRRERDKTYVARKRICMPATTDYWVNDAVGEPFFFVTTEGHRGLAKELPGILDEVKAVIPEGRRVTVVFDRGGWSMKLFAAMREDFDFITYRRKPYDDLPEKGFREYVEEEGEKKEEVIYDLADQSIELGKAGKLRLVVRRDPKGEQVHILTTREDLSAVEVIRRLKGGRGRQENFFKYMREEFALDALVSYEEVPADGERMVVNPKRREMEKLVRKQRARVRKLEHELAAISSEDEGRPTLQGFKRAVAEKGRDLAEAKREQERLVARRAAIPKRVSLREALEHEPTRLDFERKTFSDAMKMMAYRAESGLVGILAPHHKRARDEVRKLAREALSASGDILLENHELTVQLEPLSSPHRTRALQAACAILSEQNAVYPGTDLVLRYRVRDAEDGAK